MTLTRMDPTDAPMFAHYFGAEWFALSDSDKLLIIRDCTEDDGVEDLGIYRQHIGRGNLQAYALTQRVRFTCRTCGAVLDVNAVCPTGCTR